MTTAVEQLVQTYTEARQQANRAHRQRLAAARAQFTNNARDWLGDELWYELGFDQAEAVIEAGNFHEDYLRIRTTWNDVSLLVSAQYKKNRNEIGRYYLEARINSWAGRNGEESVGLPADDDELGRFFASTREIYDQIETNDAMEFAEQAARYLADIQNANDLYSLSNNLKSAVKRFADHPIIIAVFEQAAAERRPQIEQAEAAKQAARQQAEATRQQAEVERQQAEQQRQHAIAAARAAAWHPFAVWKITYAVAILDDDGERYVDTRHSYATTPDPELDGFYNIIDRDQLVRRKFAHLVHVERIESPTEPPERHNDFSFGLTRYAYHTELETGILHPPLDYPDPRIEWLTPEAVS